MRGTLDLLKQVRKKRYDLVVDVRTDGLAYLCNARSRLSKWGKQAYGRHAVEKLMAVIREIHQGRPIPRARVWLTESEREFARGLLATLPGEHWLAFVPGNINPKKIWPPRNYAALANSLADRYAGVILDGSPAEKEYTAAVAQNLRLPYVDLAGRTNLLQAAAVLEQASLFVGSDSGPGHMAAAVGTRSLTLFSVDSPERVLPWGPSAAWIKSVDENTASISLDAVLEKVRTI